MERCSIIVFLLGILTSTTAQYDVGYSSLDSALDSLSDDLAGLFTDGVVSSADARSLGSSYVGYGQSYPPLSYAPQTYPMPQVYSYPAVQQSYGGYQQQQQAQKQPSGGGYGQKKKKKKKKPKKVFVPVVIRKKKQKKRKTIAVYKGFYIPGGTQVFGKFKKMKDCKKICEVTPNCFAADYNAWLKKCYVHTNITACEEMRSHPKLIHFKKVPCDLVETQRGLITLGTQVFGGLLQKGIKSLQDCIKKCATAGSGIAPTNAEISRQVCFGIDYDFATHKCYFHTDEILCPNIAVIGTPVQLVQAPSVINILLCPRQMTG